MPLSEESQPLTTFNSPEDAIWYQIGSRGIQKRMSQLLGDLSRVETDIDDILVWGGSLLMTVCLQQS